MATIILNNDKVKRLKDGQILTPIIPDSSLGYYKSILELSKDDPKAYEKYIDKKMADSNPTRFEYLKEVIE